MINKAPHMDLTGQTFKRLTVIGFSGRDNSGNVQWECVCICGNKATPTTSGLRSGNSGSCGCLSSEIVQTSSKTHGMCVNGKPSPEHNCWTNMKARCNNPNHPSYKHYGARGIKVCKRWLKFESFYADMGTRPDMYSLERVNNGGDYTPENCIWADRLTQANNQRRPNAFAERGYCKNGHPFVPENIRMVKRGSGRVDTMTCRECLRNRQRRYRAKKKAKH